jgi:hypothetical protein
VVVATGRRRRALFVVLLSVAIVGAAVFTTSVLAHDLTWRLVLQVGGLAACAAATTTAAVAVLRWGSDDDFWWLDADRDPQDR